MFSHFRCSFVQPVISCSDPMIPLSALSLDKDRRLQQLIFSMEQELSCCRCKELERIVQRFQKLRSTFRFHLTRQALQGRFDRRCLGDILKMRHGRWFRISQRATLPSSLYEASVSCPKSSGQVKGGAKLHGSIHSLYGQSVVDTRVCRIVQVVHGSEHDNRHPLMSGTVVSNTASRGPRLLGSLPQWRN
jgi:hypothetical protein